MSPRSAPAGLALVMRSWLAGLVLLAGCVGVKTTEDLRRQAAAEPARPPAQMPTRPAWMSEPRSQSPDLAGQSLDAVRQALAPLRNEPETWSSTVSPEVEQALALVRQGDADQAVQVLLARVRVSPQDVEAWRNLARLFDQGGRPDLGSEAWGRVLSIRALDPEALAAGGIAAAAARKPLLAAERLLLLEQLQRVGEAPQADGGRSLALSVALGLSLRELGYHRASLECLRSAAAGTESLGAPSDGALREQAADLWRLASEGAMSSGDPATAAQTLERSLALSDAADPVALPRLVWTMLAAGRPWSALRCTAEAAADPEAPGHAGVAEALAMLRAAAVPIPDLDDLAWPQAEKNLLAIEVQQQGPTAGIGRAVDRLVSDPWSARSVAERLRGLPVPPAQVRAILQSRHASEAARLILAHYEQQGGDAEAAWYAATEAAGSARFAVPLLEAAARAAADMEDGSRLERISADAVSDASLLATVAQAWAALGQADRAESLAEQAIMLDKSNAHAWLARARADLARASIDPDPDSWRQQARISAERAWEADPRSQETCRRLLQLTPDEVTSREEVRELLATDPSNATARREWERWRALSRARQGQGEPVLETLRMLLLEDPCDGEAAAALVAASAAASRLPETEAWLESLQARRPGCMGLLEALVSAKARQGRLVEGVETLRQASQADPSSRARRRAWARGLGTAGRNAEAWSVMATESDAGPRAALEQVEAALRAARASEAMERLQRLLQAADLTPAQRLTMLALAWRLPKSLDGRRELLAQVGRQVMDVPQAGPSALAAAMLEGTDAEAAVLASSRAQAWPPATTLMAAQSLLDEACPDRAVLLIRGAQAEDASPEDRRALHRAELAILAQLARSDEAMESLRQARIDLPGPVLAEGDPGGVSVAREIAALADIFLLAGHDAQAEALFARAVEDGDADAGTLNNLAWLRIVRGELDARTGELVQAALAADPANPSTLDTAGWWHHLRPDTDPDGSRGIELLQKATAVDDPSLEAMDHLGDALWIAGRHEDATRTWRLVVEAGGGRGTRERMLEAFDRMQQRRWGLRAWDASSFYDARDGSAVGRAQAKLKALAEGQPPSVVPRPQPLSTQSSTPPSP
jgi:tetratricopeptide (TPR) repeat protein